jgi:hypothetical protein
MKYISHFAHFFSWIFLPLLMPVYGFLIALYIPTYQNTFVGSGALYTLHDEAKSMIFYIFFVFSAVAPAAAFLILRARNVISTIDMENRRERSIPMYIMLTFCLLLYFLFATKIPADFPKFIVALPLSGVLVTISFTIINRWIKISLHGGGAGILTGFLVAYSFFFELPLWTLLFAIISSGLTIASRLYLKKHTQTEVYTGWLLAFFITFATNYFYP